MPQIKNLGYGSLAIKISDDNQIVIGPRETKDLSHDEADSEGVRKAMQDELIAVLPGEAQPEKKHKAKPNSE